jgi:hypothetical protein
VARTFSIAKATPVVTTSGGTFTYDGVAHASTGTATVAGGFAYVYTPGGASAPVNASATPYLVTATFTPADAANYNGAIATNTITVNKATPAIAWTAPANITSGTALSAAQLNATANVPGSFVYAPPAGTVLPVGVGQILSVAFTPADALNYNAATATVSMTVVAVTPPPPPAEFAIAPIKDQSNTEGDEVELQVVVVGARRSAATGNSIGNHDDDERNGLFAAAGLPGGLRIDKEDGEISGRIKSNTAGTYNVTVTFTQNGVTVYQRFVWKIAKAAPRKGGKG